MVDRKYRPNAPSEHGDDIEHRRMIAERANVGLPLDGSQEATYPLRLKAYTVATLPTASDWSGGVAMCSDETGGYTMVISNGSNWVRVQDLATAS